MDIYVIYGFLGIGLLFLLLFLGVPVAFSLGISGIVLGTVIIGYDKIWGFLGEAAYQAINEYALTVIPLFILMGTLAFEGGLSRQAYKFGYDWLGRIKGGLLMATIAACGLFAAICGSAIATCATIGKIGIKNMEEYDYDPGIAAGAATIGGTLGPLIPPSIMVVIVGMITRLPIGKMLIAVIIPGILSMLMYMLAAFTHATIRPHIAPLKAKAASWKERFVSLVMIWPMIAIFVIVIGGIYSGIFTPTEAAAVGVIAIMLHLAITSKGTFLPRLRNSILEALSITVMIFAIVVFANVFNKGLMLSGFSSLLSEIMSGVHGVLGPKATAVVMLATYLPLGMFLEGMSMALITLPVYMPIVKSLGLMPPIVFAILQIKLADLGGVTPPVGLLVFTVHGVAPHIPMGKIFRGVLSFLVMDIFITMPILIFFPQIITFLPSLMGK